MTVRPVDAAGDSVDPEEPGIGVTVRSDGQARFRVVSEGRQTLAWAMDDGSTRWVFLDGDVFRVEIDAPAVVDQSALQAGRGRRAVRARGKPGSESLSAPMPARVVRILVSPGQRVTRGEFLILLEAMKMELPLRAPGDAVVASIHCDVGDLVQPGVPLVDLQ